MHLSHVPLTTLAAFLLLSTGPSRAAQPPAAALTVWAYLRDGRSVVGTMPDSTLTATVDGKTRRVSLRDLLSLHIGKPILPSSAEAARVSELLGRVQGTDRNRRDAAGVEIADVGVPAASLILAAYKDTDAHEPNPLYRLFARVMPGYADTQDRTLDLIRMANGETLRGTVAPENLKLTQADGKEVSFSTSDLWRLAIRRKQIAKTVDVQALYHCTQIEFLDTGIAVTPEATVEETSKGFVRLSFDMDGWASDPDGLKVPGPNYKTNLVDGFPFGALVARVGADGPRWLAGTVSVKTGLGSAVPAHLQLAVNDNGHWQNNIGSFRVKLRATDAYDIGDPQ